VVVVDGTFELVRAASARRLLAVEGVRLDLPMFGEPDESDNLVGLVEVNGRALEEELAIRVESKDDTLRFLFPGREASRVYGSVVVSLGTGLAFATDLGVRMAGLDPFEVHPLADVGWTALDSRFRGGGWLLAPGSWNGLAALEAAGVTCRLAGTPVVFDQAACRLNLARGVLQSPDFRLIGDSGAVLGNGWMTANDGSAVVRVVVPESIVGMMNEQLAERVPDGDFAFKPLDPGNRWYSDVSIWRREGGWMVAFGDGGAVVPMEEILNGG
jgi:hypothetical protein